MSPNLHADPNEFVRGSIILCQNCRRPVYALERGIGPWERASRASSAFRPLRRADMDALLAERPDVPAWYQNAVRVWLRTERGQAVYQLERPHAGDPCDCPFCESTWVTFEERLEGSAHDRGYTLVLKDVPPLPTSHGWRHGRRWVDDDAPDLVVEERPAL